MRDRSGTSLIGYALVVTAISIALTVAAIPLRGAMEQASIRLESGLSIASGLHEADKEQRLRRPGPGGGNAKTADFTNNRHRFSENR